VVRPGPCGNVLLLAPAPVTRRIRFETARFAREAIKDWSRRYGTDVGELVTTAILYYLSELTEGRPSLAVPRFRHDPADVEGEQSTTINAELALEDADWRALLAEADRQCVSTERLLEHVVIFYLSELDSGRVAMRILKGAENDGPDEPG
jgi:hypothetical protein